MDILDKMMKKQMRNETYSVMLTLIYSQVLSFSHSGPAIAPLCGRLYAYIMTYKINLLQTMNETKNKNDEKL